MSPCKSTAPERFKPAAAILALLVAFVSAFGSVIGAGGTQWAVPYFSQTSAEHNSSDPQTITRAHRPETQIGFGVKPTALPASKCAFPRPVYADADRATAEYPSRPIAFTRIRDGLTRAPPLG